jgi:hypothetical protein
MHVAPARAYIVLPGLLCPLKHKALAVHRIECTFKIDKRTKQTRRLILINNSGENKRVVPCPVVRIEAHLLRRAFDVVANIPFDILTVNPTDMSHMTV